ncbi:MAG: nucleoside monophosphate kinase [Alphaproteobacteria bacterium]|nr:nucleoside monophosphate kinase [Alphaproteobacteria bacterium]
MHYRKTNFSTCTLQKDCSQKDIKIYVVFGYPGAGKGTFAEILQERGYKHLSTGNILREEIRLKTPLGLKYQKEINASSSLLPENVIQDIILKKIMNLLQNQEKCILDGFPKTLEQAQQIDQMLTLHSYQEQVRFIYLDVSLYVALQRIQNRQACSACGKLYNLITLQPKTSGTCDLCKQALFKRPCDNADTFVKRIELYNQTVKEVIDLYKTQGKLTKMNANFSLEHFTKNVLQMENAHSAEDDQ